MGEILLRKMSFDTWERKKEGRKIFSRNEVLRYIQPMSDRNRSQRLYTFALN